MRIDPIEAYRYGAVPEFTSTSVGCDMLSSGKLSL